MGRYPRVAQYVAAYSAVTADYAAPGERRQAHQIFLADLVRDRSTLSCPPSTSIREAARLLSESGTQALALANGKELTGILTPNDFLRWIAAGAESPEQTVDHLSQGTIVMLAPQTLVSDCVLAMAEARATAAAMTGDGTKGTALQGVVSAASLVPAFGDHPLVILREIASAPRVESLRALNERARAWILDSLAATADLDWIAAFADLVNRGILERLTQISPDSAAGVLCFCGEAGRRELLTAVAPRVAVIGPAPAGLAEALSNCGYLDAQAAVAASLEEWKARFSGWIRDPIRNQISQARPFFDLRPVLAKGP
jgi:CBS domain-containing protein